ncbi:tyrosine-type recombinase/integrase [Listeria grayi]|uniref:Site-specific recombinase, phage integrase family n=1 Tax=Listeria grayi DSM 20601 TaxID=525367 RepID=D7UXJ4_LISGR|nr:tyrosine-type recombinase/integrase [Listeria grayi]EFI84402.1 site-specific recombinase, phage integrase family [Listeria grayi DSM 20601]
MVRRRKLTEAEKSIINKVVRYDDDFLIEDFIRSRRLKNVRETTIKYYLDIFNVLNRDKVKVDLDKPLSELSQRDLEDIVMYWKKSLKVTSINSKIKAFKAFYNYLFSKKYIKVNPVADFSLLRQREEIRKTLEANEIKKIANYYKRKETFTAFRDLVLFQLLLDTGLRISEAINIKVPDIHDDYIVVVETKNLTQRIVYISKSMKQKLNSYISIRGECNHQYLFIIQDGTKYTKYSFQESLRNAGRMCQLRKQVSPHVCRRTYAKNAILSGMDAFSLASLLGHSSLEVTKRYVQIWGNDLKKQAKLKRDYGNLF